MTFLRSLVDDLIEKRLWPVAVALVVALVAIPVVLGRGSDAPAASPVASVASAGAPASGQTALVNVDPSLGEGREPQGKVRNPFKQQHVPSAVTSTSTATAPSSGGAGSSAAGGSSQTASSGGDAVTGTSTTPAPDAGTPSTPSTDKLKDAPKTDPRDTYRVSLRFGEAGNQRTIKDIARLTPLPSSTDPFFVFLGVLADGKTAVFMVSSDASPTGDGSCRPKLTDCETIQLKAGDSEFFDLATGTAGVVQYQLDLLSVSKRRATTARAAAARHARESKAGRIILRAAVAEKDPGYRYVASFGVLRESDLKTAVEAHVPAGALGSAAATDGDEGAALPPVAAPAE